MFRPVTPTVSKPEVGGTSFQKTARPPHWRSIPSRKPWLRRARRRKGLSGVSPWRGSGPRGTPSTFKKAMSPTDPSPRRGVRTGRLLAPSQRSRASLRRAAAPRQTRARPRDTPPPPPRAPRPSAPTPTRHPSAPAAPHPSRRRAPAHPAPCQPDAAQSRRLRNPAGTPPRRAPRPSAPQPLLGPSPRHRPTVTASPADGTPPAATLTVVSGAAGGRTLAAAGARHQRSAPPGAASFSPGLAGTSAHGSPHRGYF